VALAIHHGAVYYFQVFSTRYHSKLLDNFDEAKLGDSLKKSDDLKMKRAGGDPFE